MKAERWVQPKNICKSCKMEELMATKRASRIETASALTFAQKVTPLPTFTFTSHSQRVMIREQ